MRTTRFLLLATLASFTSMLSAADKPNIILIMLDDVSPDMYSCYAPYTPKGSTGFGVRTLLSYLRARSTDG